MAWARNRLRRLLADEARARKEEVARVAEMDPKIEWLAKQNVMELERTLLDPEFRGDRGELELQLKKQRRELSPPRRPLFGT